MIKRSRGWVAANVLAAGCMGYFVAGTMAANVPIVSDDFNGTNGTALGGLQPRLANLPGQNYVTNDYFSQTTTHYDSSAGAPANAAYSGANNDTYVSIQSGNGYTKPGNIHISADIQVNSLTYAAIGFFTADPGLAGPGPTYNGTFNAPNGFYGVALDSSGTLNLRQNGAGTLINTFSPALGSYSTSTFYTLSYDVNFASGDISNITLSNGVASATYDVATSSFTDANTKFAAFGSVGGGGLFSHIDNFLVATPEPSSCGLLAGGALGLALRRRRASHPVLTQ